ncbi:MAG: hypothetical protein GC185_01840 [Alphaproteobacteria bacterium]|nr:hypothetical protein [Alphaproteobacteria bacterium]
MVTMPAIPPANYRASMDIKMQLASIALNVAPPGDGWVQIFPAGVGQPGFDGRGPYSLTDPAAVVAASKRPMVDLPIDRDHAADLMPSGSENPAAGWIKEMEARPDGIYARVEWTPRAAQQITDKEYRYLSPVFFTDMKGVVQRIIRATLTNIPNLEIKAVASQQTPGPDTTPQQSKQETNTMDENLTAIAALLGMTGVTDPKAIVDAVAALKKEADETKQENDAIKNAAGADAAATPDQVVTAAQKKVQGQGEPDPAKFVPVEQVKNLSSQLASLQKEVSADKASTVVDAAIKEGKLQPALREWALNLASSDMEALQGFLKNAVAFKGTQVVVDGKPIGKEEGALDAEQLNLCSQLGIKPEAFKETQAARKKA